MSPENTKPITPIADDQIDIIALAKTFWSGRRTVFISIMICGILGFFIAIFSSKEFVASAIIAPSESDAGSKLGGLGGLAAMAGINIGSSTSSELSPSVYPQIVSSLPFQLELMKTPLNFKDFKESVTFYDYYSRIQKQNLLLKYTIGLPSIIIKLFRGEQPDEIVIAKEKEPLELSSKQRDVRLILN